MRQRQGQARHPPLHARHGARHRGQARAPHQALQGRRLHRAHLWPQGRRLGRHEGCVAALVTRPSSSCAALGPHLRGAKLPWLVRAYTDARPAGPIPKHPWKVRSSSLDPFHLALAHALTLSSSCRPTRSSRSASSSAARASRRHGRSSRRSSASLSLPRCAPQQGRIGSLMISTSGTQRQPAGQDQGDAHLCQRHRGGHPPSQGVRGCVESLFVCRPPKRLERAIELLRHLELALSLAQQQPLVPISAFADALLLLLSRLVLLSSPHPTSSSTRLFPLEQTSPLASPSSSRSTLSSTSRPRAGRAPPATSTRRSSRRRSRSSTRRPSRTSRSSSVRRASLALLLLYDLDRRLTDALRVHRRPAGSGQGHLRPEEGALLLPRPSSPSLRSRSLSPFSRSR